MFILMHSSIPPISIPSFSLMNNMIADAFVISIVIFATNISLSKMFAKKNGQTIDANQVSSLAIP